MIIWLTGLSGSGKTTLSESIYNYCKNSGMKNIVWLDGDVLRNAISPNLDFTEESRIKQITKTQKLAKHLESQHHLVIVSALYSNNELLLWNRQNFDNYFEIYLSASLESLKKRDGKNLYSRALNGEIKNVVGIDIVWNIPNFPDVIIDNSSFFDINETTKSIVSKINIKSFV